MMHRKLVLSFAISVSAALALGVGCKKDDESSGDSYDCAALCETSKELECGTYDACMTECEGVLEQCSSQVEAYFECAAEASEFTCAGDANNLSIAGECASEAVAIQLCAAPGDGDMPGDGDGDTPGDGDGDMPGDGDGDMPGDGDGDMGGASGGGAGGFGGAD